MILSMFDEFGDEIFLFVLAVVLGVMIIAFVKACIKSRKEHQQLLEEMEQPYVDPQIFEYKATVIEKCCCVENHGSAKMPISCKAYYLTFKTYDGRILKYNVLEQDYFEIEENQTGTLAVVNEGFYGFCPDENS